MKRRRLSLASLGTAFAVYVISASVSWVLLFYATHYVGRDPYAPTLVAILIGAGLAALVVSSMDEVPYMKLLLVMIITTLPSGFALITLFDWSANMLQVQGTMRTVFVMLVISWVILALIPLRSDPSD